MAFFSGVKPEPKRAATHLLFRVGGQRYGAPISIVAELVAAKGLKKLNAGGGDVAYEMELRGDAIVVTDMGLRLQGKPSEPSAGSCVLVVRRQNARSGCLVDAPDELLSIAQDEIELAGCLVDAADGVTAIAPSEPSAPEDASKSGAKYGYPLYRAPDGAILLPDAEQFFPR